MRTMTCPRCRGKWQLEAIHAGMKATCPHCQATMTIAAAPPGKSGIHAAGLTTKPAASPAEAGKTSAAVKPPATGTTSVPVPEPSQRPAPEPIREPIAAQTTPAPASPTVPKVPVTSAPIPNPPTPTPATRVADVPGSPQTVEQSSERRTRLPVIFAGAAFATAAAIAVAVAVWRPWKQDEPAQEELAQAPASVVLDTPTATPEAPETVSPPTTAEIVRPPEDPVANPPIATPEPTAAPLSVPTAAPVPTPTAAESPSALAEPESQESPPTPEPIAVAKPVLSDAAPTIATPPVVAPPVAPQPTIAFQSPRHYDRAPIPEGTEGTRPVTSSTRLRSGDKLHAFYDGKWYAVTVVSSLDDGKVRVKWDTWGADYVGNIGRDKLRIAP